jgi:opacity protein-like surface antigen
MHMIISARATGPRELFVSLIAATAMVVGAPSTLEAQTRQPAPAQPAAGESRVYVSANGGFQSNTLTFTERHTEPLFQEELAWQAEYELENGAVYDGGVGVRIWRRLVAGVHYSYVRQSTASRISAQVPHPFFFNRPRPLEGESAPLTHTEQTVHVSAMWMVPGSRRIELGLLAGPSWFNVQRDFVDAVEYQEAYPYDEATFDGAAVREGSGTAIGFHAGADVTFLLTPQVGLGVLVRYSRASLDFDTPAGGSLSMDVGGLQAGAGVRFRFGGKPRVPPPTRPLVTQPAAPPVPGLAQPDREVATLIDAPVYLYPDEKRTPLRVLSKGTRVRVLRDDGEWLNVEFDDPQWGPRLGYILKRHVR